MFSKIANFFKFIRNKKEVENIVTENIEEITSNKELIGSEEQIKLESENISLIENCSFSKRTLNCLLANGIDTTEKLLSLDLLQFSNRKNVGKKTLDEIENYINNITVGVKFENKELDTKQNANIIEKEKINIDERILNIEIDNLNIQPRIIKNLKEANIQTINDLLSNSEILKEFSYSDKTTIYKTLETFGIEKNKKYQPIETQLDEKYLIKIETIFDDNWILQVCKKYNLKNLGLLAYNFPTAFLKDEELVSQEIFFEKIKIIENMLKKFGINETPTNFSYFEIEELNKKDLSEVLKINYIQEINNQVITALNNENINKTQKKLTLSEREKDVVLRRFGINYDKKQTLEEIGELYGCTRERIRQLEKKALVKIQTTISKKLEEYNSEINLLFKEIGILLHIPINIKEEEATLTKELIDKNNKLSFSIDFEKNIIFTKNFDFSKTSDEIFSQIQTLQTDLINISDIKNIINISLIEFAKNKTNEQQENFTYISQIFEKEITSKYLLQLSGEKYKLPSGRSTHEKEERNKKIIYLVEQLYKDGVHLPIDNDEVLRKNLQPLYEAYPELNKLCTRSISDRLIKEDKDIIWWSKGTYIHINNTKADMEVVNFAIKEIIQKFENGLDRIKPNLIFEEHKEKFINANIPNEIALLGLIRYVNNDRIDCQRQEIRDKYNFNSDLNILEDFEKNIKEYKNGITKEDLENELCNKRGWKPFQIDLLYNRSTVIFKDNDIFIHRQNLNINYKALEELANIIQNELNNTNKDTIPLKEIKSNYKQMWTNILHKKVSTNFMGRLLSELNNTNFLIENYVYAKRK